MRKGLLEMLADLPPKFVGAKQEGYILFGVALLGFIIQMALRSADIYSADAPMWSDQIRYFLTDDPRVFDFDKAYGHPGTTIVLIGSLLHSLFNVSYRTALDLGMSLLIAGTAAACSYLCIVLRRNSLWWLATAILLLLNRLFIHATPPTAVAMPFLVLILLFAWRLWQQEGPSRSQYVLWGAAAGLAAATRLDAALLVSAPLLLLLGRRHGSRAVLPIMAGALASFYIADPFLWSMPVRHITDLAYKFTMHYTNYSSHVGIDSYFLLNASWLSIASFSWAILLLRQKRQEQIIPSPIVIIFSCISILSFLIVLSSRYQAARYLFPMFAAWEVLLPLFALEALSLHYKKGGSFSDQGQRNLATAVILGLVVLTQLPAYTIVFTR